MKIKKGDKVTMLSGKDRGKTGKVLRVMPVSDKVVVEGLNMASKHQRPRKEGEAGQRVQFPRAILSSRVQLNCSKCQKKTRVGYRILEEGKKARSCKKCHELID